MSSKNSKQKEYDSALSINIGKLAVQALVDTGAEISCISVHLANKVPVRYQTKVNPTYTTVRGVGGETHEVLDCIVLKFKAGNKEFQHRFHVLQGHHALILGMDFMRAHGVVVNFQEGTLTLDSDTSLPLGPLSNKASLVKTTKPECIPPFSIMTVPVKLARRYDEPFLIEPTQKDSHNGSQHSVIPTLVDMKDSKPIMCRKSQV